MKVEERIDVRLICKVTVFASRGFWGSVLIFRCCSSFFFLFPFIPSADSLLFPRLSTCTSPSTTPSSSLGLGLMAEKINIAKGHAESIELTAQARAVGLQRVSDALKVT